MFTCDISTQDTRGENGVCVGVDTDAVHHDINSSECGHTLLGVSTWKTSHVYLLSPGSLLATVRAITAFSDSFPASLTVTAWRCVHKQTEVTSTFVPAEKLEESRATDSSRPQEQQGWPSHHMDIFSPCFLWVGWRRDF
jgi:hypothetical protein